MNTREILAANLAALRQKHKHLKSTLAIERESAALGEGRKIAHSVMQRVFKADTPFSLDDLQTLAELFGLAAAGASDRPRAPASAAKHRPSRRRGVQTLAGSPRRP